MPSHYRRPNKFLAFSSCVLPQSWSCYRLARTDAGDALFSLSMLGARFVPMRRKFLATPSALVPRLSCYRCWTYSHHCQIPDRNRRKDHGTENFGGFVYVLDRFPQRELGLWVFMCTIIMASLPCTGPDLLSIGQSNRYICLASQCTQRMETHFCLALANQEAHFCLALLSIAPHFAYCIAPQRSALQRSYMHTHGFCTP